MNAIICRLGLVAALIGSVAQPGPARAQAPEARFAFVVGSDAYAEAPLPTAATDAGLIAETLRQASFEVTGARNLDQETLRASYREFLDKVAAAGPSAVAAVYLSGYGLQLEGENYFVPVGARIARDTDVALNAIRISDLTRALAGLPTRNDLIILDLAYDSPFGKQGQPLAPGLALVEPDAHTLIAFNAAPGMLAPRTSPPYGAYAQALSESLRLPGLPLNDVFARARTRVAELTKGAQVPFDATDIDHDYALLAPAPPSAGQETAAADTPGMVRQMLSARLTPIRAFADSEAYVAALDRDTIAGYTDFLSIYPESAYAKNVRGLLAARREASIWRQSCVVNTPPAYWTYLARYPRGPHTSDARRRLARFAAAFEPPPNFVVMGYDVPPPPPLEEVYFQRPVLLYTDMDAPPPPRVAFLPPPPPWWVPPPPPPQPVLVEQSYFLPAPLAPPPPPWFQPQPNVLSPAPFYNAPRPPGGGASVVSYVAIPAALAAGIAAGKLLSHRNDQEVSGNAGLNAAIGTGAPVTEGPRQGRAFAPRVTSPPRSISQLQNGPAAPAPLPASIPTQSGPAPTSRLPAPLPTPPGSPEVAAPRSFIPTQPSARPTGINPSASGGTGGIAGPAAAALPTSSLPAQTAPTLPGARPPAGGLPPAPVLPQRPAAPVAAAPVGRNAMPNGGVLGTHPAATALPSPAPVLFPGRPMPALSAGPPKAPAAAGVRPAIGSPPSPRRPASPTPANVARQPGLPELTKPPAPQAEHPSGAMILQRQNPPPPQQAQSVQRPQPSPNVVRASSQRVEQPARVAAPQPRAPQRAAPACGHPGEPPCRP